MFYLGTVNGEGQPYIQYRGVTPGFLKVIDDQTLGFSAHRLIDICVTAGEIVPEGFGCIGSAANSEGRSSIRSHLGIL